MSGDGGERDWASQTALKIITPIEQYLPALEEVGLRDEIADALRAERARSEGLAKELETILACFYNQGQGSFYWDTPLLDFHAPKARAALKAWKGRG